MGLKKLYKTLYIAQNSGPEFLMFNEVIRVKDRKFNIIIKIAKDEHRADLTILGSEGNWKFVTSYKLCNIMLLSNMFCSDEQKVNECINRVRDGFLKYIKAVYVD